MKGVVTSDMTRGDFCRALDYLTDGPGECEQPLVVARARKVLAVVDTESLPAAYAAFQFGYVLAQIDAAAKWRNSHRKKDWKAFEERKKKAVALFIRLKEVRSNQTDAETEAQVARDYDCKPRTIRRWRKSLGK